jgi:hypothetical protein
MGTANDDFDIETELDLDSLDEKAGEALLRRGERAAAKKPEDDVEVEVVADERVAPEDRNVKPLPEDDNPEPTEEELAAYSEGVRKRIEKMTKARHDERREKEQAARERDEAITFAQRILAEKKALEERAAKLVTEQQSAELQKLDADLAVARKEYIDAANSYDTEAMAEAQLKISTLAARKAQAETRKSETPLAQPAADVVQRQQSARPAPDARAQDWAARNSAWFQKDKAMTAFAFGVHEELVSSGVDPRTDAELYYKKLDESVRKRFPEKFADGNTQTRTPRTSPVAPATRTATGRKKITLTTTELSLARRLGVTPEQFALEKAKLEKRNA